MRTFGLAAGLAILLCGLLIGPRAQGQAPGAEAAGIVWVSIPGGSFMMGADHYPDEKPAHPVMVRGFEMAKSVVTNKQYRACVAAGACSPPLECVPSNFLGEHYPAVCVSWKQAKAFAEWAGGRLPSEAEWEYAARSGGKQVKFPWGDAEATCRRAVFSEGGFDGCGMERTWPVCSKPEGNTEQGLCDMAGNVWQWCQDWHHENYVGAPADGAAWEKPMGNHRVIRGGSWDRRQRRMMTTHRSDEIPELRVASIGFRPVRDLPRK
ncbi:MAG: formylglycine-generating enzyme family protein [Elusimicrobiota bacterium]